MMLGGGSANAGHYRVIGRAEIGAAIQGEKIRLRLAFQNMASNEAV